MSVLGEDRQQWLQDELHRACYDGTLEEVKKLLSEGASAKLVSEGYQELPLNRAISMGHEDLVRLLVAHGAPLSDPEGSALAVAARGVPVSYSEAKTLSMIDLLLSLGADVHAYDEEATVAAAGTGLAIVKRLERAGGKATRPALVCAVRSCHPDIVEHLIKAGLDPTTTDENGRTLLHEAAEWTSLGPEDKPQVRTALWSRLLTLGISVNALDRNGRSPLFEASTEEVMAWLIEKGADVNLKDREGMTALMQVANDAGGAVELMQTLLKAGADLKAKDQKGRNAVDFAAGAESWAEMSLLLEEGATAEHAAASLKEMAQATLDHATPQEHVADITAHLLRQTAAPGAMRVDGLPLLSWAVLINNAEVARLLLKAGVDVNALDDEGRTALMLAGMSGNTAMKQTLLSAGADATRKNKQGLTAEELAAFSGRAEGPVSSGLSDGSVGAAAPEGKDDIFNAIAAGRMKELQRLVEAQPAILTQERGGLQPLHLAIALGRLPMVEWLVKHGAALSARTVNRQSCLRVALLAGQDEVARWMLKQQDDFGRAAMMEDLYLNWAEKAERSGKGGSVLALRLALEAGWKPDGKEHDRTALELAVCSNELALVQQLLNLGAVLTPVEIEERDPFVGGPSYKNLIQAAAERHSARMLNFLLEKISARRVEWKENINAALHFAADAGDLAMVKLLVEEGGADVNASAERFYGEGTWSSYAGKKVLFTPLCLAMAKGHREVAEYLLRHGARAAGHDQQGRQVLSSAVATGKIELVRLMLDHGAALEARNGGGGTALHEAARRGVSDITALLLSKGASREAKDGGGRTPAELAQSAGQTFP
ncbi:ankyrin repeat domain-containing protein [Prosthecobacter sp.]|uniref:ankyrin repeat domain-containing protein n=1 Tax=Prosthecobacter sp. TaxID=1965333 RepID=UPI0037835109